MFTKLKQKKNSINMYPLTFLIAPFSVFLSMSTATGVFVHDTKLDKVTVTVLSTQAATAAGHQASTGAPKLTTDPHTHAERGSLSQSVNDVKNQNPRVHPRNNEDKKYLTQKSAALGHDDIDGYRTLF